MTVYHIGRKLRFRGREIPDSKALRVAGMEAHRRLRRI